MDTPFTKINLSMFMTYITILTCKFHGDGASAWQHRAWGSSSDTHFLFKMNRILGAVTFNTSLAIMLPWEATRVLYPTASTHLITKVMSRYNISRPVFEFLNFVAHIFPVIYLTSVRKHWLHYSKDIRTVILSMLIHGVWLRCIPKHYNLNRVYMFNTKVLEDSQWLQLWGLSFVGHCSPYILQTIVNSN